MTWSCVIKHSTKQRASPNKHCLQIRPNKASKTVNSPSINNQCQTTIKKWRDAVKCKMMRRENYVVYDLWPRPQDWSEVKNIEGVDLLVKFPLNCHPIWKLRLPLNLDPSSIDPIIELDPELKILSTMVETGFDYVVTFWRYPVNVQIFEGMKITLFSISLDF